MLPFEKARRETRQQQEVVEIEAANDALRSFVEEDEAEAGIEALNEDLEQDIEDERPESFPEIDAQQAKSNDGGAKLEAEESVPQQEAEQGITKRPMYIHQFCNLLIRSDMSCSSLCYLIAASHKQGDRSCLFRIHKYLSVRS